MGPKPAAQVHNILTVAPDGDYGWVIIAISFYAVSIVDLPSFAFPAISEHLSKELKLPAHVIATICSSYILIMFIAGPFAAGLCNRFGFRLAIFFGSVFAILGKLPAYWVHDFFLYLILYGFIGGIGGSLIFMFCCVAPGFWFEKKRAIVMGISSSATGACCIIAVLSKEVAAGWGWRSTFLFWTAFFVILLLMTVLVKAPPTVEVLPGTPDVKMQGMLNKALDKKLFEMSAHAGISLSRTLSVPSRVALRDRSLRHKCFHFFCRCFEQEDAIASRPMNRSDIFYHGSIAYVAKKESIDPRIYGLSVAKLPTVKDVEQEVKCHCAFPESIRQGILEMLDFSLFKSLTFHLLAISALFQYLGLFIPYVMLNNLNARIMEDKYAKISVPLLGAGCAASRMIIGFFLMIFPHFGVATVLGISTLLSGLTTCMFAYGQNMYYQYSLAFCCGCFLGVYVPLRSIVIIEYLGLMKLTSAMGLLWVYQGFGSFIGLPAAEWFIEQTGDPYAGMYFSGICLFISSFSLIILRCIHH